MGADELADTEPMKAEPALEITDVVYIGPPPAGPAGRARTCSDWPPAATIIPAELVVDELDDTAPRNAAIYDIVRAKTDPAC